MKRTFQRTATVLRADLGRVLKSVRRASKPVERHSHRPQWSLFAKKTHDLSKSHRSREAKARWDAHRPPSS